VDGILLGVTDGFTDGVTLGNEEGRLLGLPLGTEESVEDGLILGVDDGLDDGEVDRLGRSDGERDLHGSHVSLQVSDTPEIMHILSISTSLISLHRNHFLTLVVSSGSDPSISIHSFVSAASSKRNPSIESEFISSSHLPHVSGQAVLTPL